MRKFSCKHHTWFSPRPVYNTRQNPGESSVVVEINLRHIAFGLKARSVRNVTKKRTSSYQPCRPIFHPLFPPLQAEGAVPQPPPRATTDSSIGVHLTPLRSMVTGLGAGFTRAASRTLTFPLDTLKTRSQVSKLGPEDRAALPEVGCGIVSAGLSAADRSRKFWAIADSLFCACARGPVAYPLVFKASWGVLWR